MAAPGSAALARDAGEHGSSVGAALTEARRDPTSADTDRPRPRNAPLVHDNPDQRKQLPDKSGKGQRIVYSLSRQRTWLVGEDGRVVLTYLVSGQRSQPSPGRYEVYSKSRHARSSLSAERMQFMVRFAYGQYTGAPIGFHSIPVGYDGKLVQRYDQLGEPHSSGCVRQRWRDARDLWNFATIGTRVVVTG